MILEAFSQELKMQENRDRSPEHVLFEWLTRILLFPPAPDDMVGRVIHAEIAFSGNDTFTRFEGKSETGRKLLNSLYQYCRSYDHWQFSRWVHVLQASDFVG